MLPNPRALLLDFGGVIADAPAQPSASPELVRRIHALIEGALPDDVITAALIAGAEAYASWRDRVSAEPAPAELAHVQVWEEFVTQDWPVPARDAVRRAATALSYAWTWHPQWLVRPGITEVLRSAEERGMPVAIVSNTLCGAAHRDFLSQLGLTDRFAVQLYSDEIGVRKPNPEMAWRAARQLDVPIDVCWFVGDSRNRDIACARRAGVGAAILMRSGRTDRELRVVAGGPSGGDGAPEAPDATVDDGFGLLGLLPGQRSL